jgi:hypothetical protein
MAVADIVKLSEVNAWKKCRFVFYGYVKYVDVLGTHYVSGFCHLYDGLRNRFVRIGDDRYNYTKKIAGD